MDDEITARPEDEDEELIEQAELLDEELLDDVSGGAYNTPSMYPGPGLGL